MLKKKKPPALIGNNVRASQTSFDLSKPKNEKIFPVDADSSEEAGHLKKIAVTNVEGLQVGSTEESPHKLVIPYVGKSNNIAEKRKQVEIAASVSRTSNRTAYDGSKYGLQVMRTSTKEPCPAIQKSASKIDLTVAEARCEKSVDELAMEALLNQDAKIGSQRTIIVAESEKFRADYATCPDESALETYEKIPVEEFGEALLRGMGWRDGESLGKRKNGPLKPVELTARPQNLGLGAKDLPSELKKRRK